MNYSDISAFPEKGDIRRVESLLGLKPVSRVAFVIGPNSRDRSSVEIMLVHGDIEMATPDDIIVDSGIELFPNGLVIQTGIRGTVWENQFTGFLCRLPNADIHNISNIAKAHESERRVARTGTPMTQAGDPRFAYQAKELRELRALTEDHNDAMLDGNQPWLLDPGLLSPRLLYRSNNPDMILSDVMHVLNTRRVVISEEDLDYLGKEGTFETKAWANQNNNYEQATTIVDGIRILPSNVFPNQGLARVSTPPRRYQEHSIVVSPGIRFITAPFLWEDEGEELMSLASGDGTETLDGFELMFVATPGEATNIESGR